MEINYTLEAGEDLNYWKMTGNQTILKKIRSLIESIMESPFEGIGKPELLKYNLSGCWSRRINHEHRIVYRVIGDTIEILSLKGHY